jgi:hypothetical protein
LASAIRAFHFWVFFSRRKSGNKKNSAYCHVELTDKIIIMYTDSNSALVIVSASVIEGAYAIRPCAFKSGWANIIH